jgi:hypothetical protein
MIVQLVWCYWLYECSDLWLCRYLQLMYKSSKLTWMKEFCCPLLTDYDQFNYHLAHWLQCSHCYSKSAVHGLSLPRYPWVNSLPCTSPKGLQAVGCIHSACNWRHKTRSSVSEIGPFSAEARIEVPDVLPGVSVAWAFPGSVFCIVSIALQSYQ